ncbi:MAG: hypothetical protein RLZZ86_2549 [Cyanobacteriota bacterium]|jgi:hypothetical protein
MSLKIPIFTTLIKEFLCDLSWLQVKDAKTWLHILCIKTGLGSIKKQDNIKVCIEVIDKNGQNNNYQQQGIGYLWIHELPLQIKNARFYDIKDKKDSLYKKDKKDNIYLRPYHGVTHIMYNRYTNEHEMNLIVIEELIDFLNNPEEEEERQKEKYEG